MCARIWLMVTVMSFWLTAEGIIVADRDSQAIIQDMRQPDSLKLTTKKKQLCQATSNAKLHTFMGAAYNPRYMSIDYPGTRGRHQSMNVLDDGGIEDTGDKMKASDMVDRQANPHQQHNHKSSNKQHHHTAEHPTKNRDAIQHKSQNPTINDGVTHTGDSQRPHQNQKSTTASTETMTFARVDKPPSSDEPEQLVTSNLDKVNSSHRNRRAVEKKLSFTCESQIEWIDLGPNYFPRYLREVVCKSDFCFNGKFHCRPWGFPVRVLRRRKDSCVPRDTRRDDRDYLSGQALDEETGVVLDENLFDINERVPDEFQEQWVFEERSLVFCCRCGT